LKKVLAKKQVLSESVRVTNYQNTTMTKITAQRNIEGIIRCIPEVEKLIQEAKANGNKKHEEAQTGYLMSLRRQLEIYKQALA
jgi:hypothetical protein